MKNIIQIKKHGIICWDIYSWSSTITVLGRANCSENTTINLSQKFIIYRWTFDGQKDGHISEIASLICRNKIRQKLDFVGVEGPPVLGGANDPAFAHQATVRRIGTVDERI